MTKLSLILGLTVFLAAGIILGTAAVSASAGAAAASSRAAATTAASPAAPMIPTPKTYFFTWYDSKPADSMNGDWIVVGNLEDYAASVLVYFGDETTPRESFTLGAKGRQTVAWDNTMGGPVKVISTSGAALAVTQRVIYRDSFNEVAAIEQSNLDTSYNFTWYDSLLANGMMGNWLLIANEDISAAQVDVFIGAGRKYTYTLAPGQSITPSYPGVMDGPVRVVSNGPKIIASQRVLYKGSFNEVMGFPSSRLDSIYFFTWYDMTGDMHGNWVLIANNNDTTVHAQVYIGDDPRPRGTYAITPHQSATPTYPGTMDGPVRVVCTDCADGQNIMVSQRVLYKNSFEEVQGTPPAGLDNRMYFGWYDFTPVDGVAGDWLLIANQAAGDAAVDVYIGDSLESKATYTIGERGRETPEYLGVRGGPVRVESRDGKPLLASQRVIYKDSFNELLGLTRKDTGQPLPEAPQLRLYRLNTYWASAADYEARKLSVSMRIADNGAGTAYGTTVTGLTATNGVRALTTVPLSLGDLPGNGGYKNFTVQYSIPPDVTTFSTGIDVQCEDSSGARCSYP